MKSNDKKALKVIYSKRTRKMIRDLDFKKSTGGEEAGQ